MPPENQGGRHNAESPSQRVSSSLGSDPSQTHPTPGREGVEPANEGREETNIAERMGRGGISERGQWEEGEQTESLESEPAHVQGKP